MYTRGNSVNVRGVALKLRLSKPKHAERGVREENVHRHVREPGLDVFVPMVSYHESSKLSQNGYCRVFTLRGGRITYNVPPIASLVD